MSSFVKVVRRIFVAIFAVAVVWALAQASPADAAECKLTQRGDTAQSAQLGIQNGTTSDLTIRFYRDDVGEGQLKKTQTIKPGKRAEFNYGLGGAKKGVTPMARIAIGDRDIFECYFIAQNLWWTEGSKVYKKTEWQEGDCQHLEGAGNPCKDCAHSCEKSYNQTIGAWRWRTTFKITD
jgi:hypothetical protein